MRFGKRIDYVCRDCGRVQSRRPHNDHCVIRFRAYGHKLQYCRCGDGFFHPGVTEPAAALTERERVPFLMTGAGQLAGEGIAALVLALALTAAGRPGLAALTLPAAAAFHLILSAATRNYRQEHKNRLLRESRDLLERVPNMVGVCLLEMGMPAQYMLFRPQEFEEVCLQEVRRAKAEDRPLDLNRLLREIEAMNRDVVVPH